MCVGVCIYSMLGIQLLRRTLLLVLDFSRPLPLYICMPCMFVNPHARVLHPTDKGTRSAQFSVSFFILHVIQRTRPLHLFPAYSVYRPGNRLGS